jgi:prepilin-type processing-associated H-X9-DG protein
MVSEKAYNTYYMKEVQFGDRLGYFTGFGITTLRSGSRRPVRDFDSEVEITIDRFGSSHPFSMNALFADGSVRQISYSIPDIPVVAQVWTPLMLPFGVQALPMQRLCHRSDGQKVELTQIDD